MSVNGTRDNFTVEDLRRVAKVASLKRGQPKRILAEVAEAVREWPELADKAGIDGDRITRIGRTHRLSLPQG